jgi:HD-GYP domain-containing protein (c-di-GMP phosphodiesterase class II)
MDHSSDTNDKRDKKEPTRESPEKKVEEQASGLTDSQIAKVLSSTQITKVRGGKTPFAPLFEEEWGAEVKNCYEKFIARATDTLGRVKNNQQISPTPIFSDLNYVLDRNLTEKLYECAMLAPGDYDQLVVHNVRVAFISLIVGQGLRYDIRMLLKLGLAALLENVGMCKIPESILQKRGKLNEKEMAIIRGHPKSSYEILAAMGEKYQWLAEVALQVHERSDGSGYPYGLKGEEIYQMSSIIGLIDVYVAMISDRPHRDKFATTDPIKFIVEEGKGLFPASIRRVFLDQISLFPVNTLVRLNNKSIGRVVSTDKAHPLRPRIEILYDTAGKKMEAREVIRLSEKPLLYITESIHEKELRPKED